MGGGAALQQVLFFALLISGCTCSRSGPQRARARALAEVRAALAPGSRVVTTAGIHADVVEVEHGRRSCSRSPRACTSASPTAAVVRVLDDPAARPASGRRGRAPS